MRRPSSSTLLALAALLAAAPTLANAANTIRKNNFNFALQSGYLYSRFDDAWFPERGTWTFGSGGLAYYKHEVPLVENPEWQKRVFLQVPGDLRMSPADNVVLQISSDLVGEFPIQDKHSLGGNSPRFRVKVRVARETPRRPAVAFTVGTVFSSAKPTNIWAGRLNYWDSNGLAGLGTGVADYFLVLQISKHLDHRHALHTHIGLAPVGDPTAFERGSSQADEIPYGLRWEMYLGERWTLLPEVAGMFGILSTTTLDHYSVFRIELQRRFERARLILDIERGLTPESDDVAGGLRFEIDWHRRSDHETEACRP